MRLGRILGAELAWGLFVGFAILTAIRCAAVYHLPQPGEPECFGHCDFHNAVYYPGKGFLAGDNPYSADYARKHPVNRELSPYSPLLFPFAAAISTLPLWLADWIWFGLNLALIPGYAWLVLRYLRNSTPTAAETGWWSFAILISRPGNSNLTVGQLALWMSLAVLVAVRDADSNPWKAGIAIAAASIKPTFGLPLGLLLLAGGQIRAALIGGILAIAGAAIPAWGIANSDRDFYQTLANSHDAHSTSANVAPSSAHMRADFVAILGRWWDWLPTATEELAAMLILLAPAMAILFHHRRTSGRDRFLLRVLVAGLAIVTSIYHDIYDILVILPAFALLLDSTGGFPWIPRAWRVPLMILLLWPFANYLSTWTVLRHLSTSAGFTRDILVQSSGLCLITAYCLTLFFAWRRKGAFAGQSVRSR